MSLLNGSMYHQDFASQQLPPQQTSASNYYDAPPASVSLHPSKGMASLGWATGGGVTSSGGLPAQEFYSAASYGPPHDMCFPVTAQGVSYTSQTACGPAYGQFANFAGTGHTAHLGPSGAAMLEPNHSSAGVLSVFASPGCASHDSPCSNSPDADHGECLQDGPGTEDGSEDSSGSPGLGSGPGDRPTVIYPWMKKVHSRGGGESEYEG